MRRLFCGIFAAVFIVSLALESSHQHYGQVPRSCVVCALGVGAARHALASAPTLSQPTTWVYLSSFLTTTVPSAKIPDVTARAPPIA